MKPSIRKRLRRYSIFLVMYILFGMSAYIAIECSWMCAPVSFVLAIAGIIAVELYATDYDYFHSTPWEE